MAFQMESDRVGIRPRGKGKGKDKATRKVVNFGLQTKLDKRKMTGVVGEVSKSVRGYILRTRCQNLGFNVAIGDMVCQIKCKMFS